MFTPCLFLKSPAFAIIVNIYFPEYQWKSPLKQPFQALFSNSFLFPRLGHNAHSHLVPSNLQNCPALLFFWLKHCRLYQSSDWFICMFKSSVEREDNITIWQKSYLWLPFPRGLILRRSWVFRATSFRRCRPGSAWACVCCLCFLCCWAEIKRKMVSYRLHAWTIKSISCKKFVQVSLQGHL